MPRIISGSARGTRLAAPRGEATRPTGDKVKEALFSILNPQMPANGFLDLFAGTGQIGLEAASRGSKSVVLVEKGPEGLAAIKTNRDKTHLTDQTEVMAAEAGTALQQLINQGRRFEIIFLDPPWRIALQEFKRLGPRLAQLLEPGGLVVLEHEAREEPPAFVTYLQLMRSCQYGTAMISFYKAEMQP